LIASTVYFAGISAIGLSCLVVFFCRQYIRYFPRPLIWPFGVELCALLSDLLMHTPIAPAKNLWLMLVMAAHSLIPVMTVYALSSMKHENLPANKWFLCLVSLSICCVILGLYRIPYIELHSEWQLNRSLPAIITQYYYPVLTINAFIYLALSAISLGIGWQVMQKIQADADKHRLAKILYLSLFIGILINIGRIAHCNLDGVPGFISLALSVLDVFVSCAFWLAILVAILRMTLQDLEVADQVTLSASIAKYEKHTVSSEDSARIQKKLEQALKNRDIVTDNTLTLARLSAHIGEKHHAVSQVINRDFESSFFDLIYGQRIELACSMIKAQPSTSIIEIYTEVGFNSKTTFYKAFAKRKAQTPAEFRKQAAQA
jgi:AraC-like DNA-binding protein